MRSNPSDLVARYDLAWAYHNLGLVLQRKGDLAGAERNFREAYRLRRELVALDGQNGRWRKDLALSHDALGDIANAQKNASAAADQYGTAIGILSELTKAEPTNRGWRDSLAVIYNKLGDIQRCRNDLDGMLTSYTESLAIRSKLLAENEEDFATMLRVARSEKLVAEALQLRGKAEEARAYYQQAAEEVRRLLRHDPKNADASGLLSIVEKRIEPNHAEAADNLRACTGA
jgi:Flp pilus assembly protein TadD